MKPTLRILSLILVLFTFTALAMGSSSGEKEIITGPNSVDGSVQSDAESGDETSNDASEGQSQLPTLEKVLLVDEELLKITAVEYIHDSIWGAGIKVLIENNDSYDITVTLDALIVNDYMIYNLFVETVAAGKKTNSTIYLSSSELEAAGIDNIGKVELYFCSYPADHYSDRKTYPPVTVHTSLFDQMDASANDMGTELYNANGVRIVGKYVNEETFWGSAVLLYIENSSGKNITVSCTDLSVNGFMVTSFLSSTVYDGKKSIDEIDLLNSSLEESGIESIDSIELKFRIYNTDSYSDAIETDPISFSVKH